MSVTPVPTKLVNANKALNSISKLLMEAKQAETIDKKVDKMVDIVHAITIITREITEE